MKVLICVVGLYFLSASFAMCGSLDEPVEIRGSVSGAGSLKESIEQKGSRNEVVIGGPTIEEEIRRCKNRVYIRKFGKMDYCDRLLGISRTNIIDIN